MCGTVSLCYITNAAAPRLLPFLTGGGFVGATIGWLAASQRSGSSFWSDPSVIATCYILATPVVLLLNYAVCCLSHNGPGVLATAMAASLIRELARWINRRDDPQYVKAPSDSAPG